ncbi:Ankyrin repeat protein [Mycena kentingensis (nom. inval.)]|nr:Ankyrin repeat protein [Mycena kentingensis (nom. inval.)]
MTVSLLSLPPELHQLIATFLTTEVKNETLPHLPNLNALAQTCSQLHQSVQCMLFDVCRKYRVLGEHALGFAVRRDRPDLLDSLVCVGVSLAARLVFVRPVYEPLHLAAWLRHPDVVEKLLELYAEDAPFFAYTRIENKTPLDYAACARAMDIVPLLADIQPSLQHNSDGASSRYCYINRALCWAATDDRTQVLSFLLERYPAEVDPNFFFNAGADEDDWTPTALFAACNGPFENLGVVRQLLAAGANPNIFMPNHIPLLAAARGNHIDIIEALLEAGADIHVRDDRLCGGIHHALYYGMNVSQSRTLRLLLERGADPNRADADSVTPMHLACAWKYDPGDAKWAVGLLLEFGGAPSVNHVSGAGQTPVDVARSCSGSGLRQWSELVEELLLPHITDEKKRQETIDWLRSRRVKNPTELDVATRFTTALWDP